MAIKLVLDQPVLAALLHALHEHGPVVVVSVHDGSEQVDPLEHGEPEPVLPIRHHLTQGGNVVEVTVAG